MWGIKSANSFLMKLLLFDSLDRCCIISIVNVKIFYLHVDIDLLRFIRRWRHWSPAIRVTGFWNFCSWRKDISGGSRLFLWSLLEGFFLGKLQIFFAKIIWSASELLGFAFFMCASFSLHFRACLHILLFKLNKTWI